MKQTNKRSITWGVQLCQYYYHCTSIWVNILSAAGMLHCRWHPRTAKSGPQTREKGCASLMRGGLTHVDTVNCTERDPLSDYHNEHFALNLKVPTCSLLNLQQACHRGLYFSSRATTTSQGSVLTIVTTTSPNIVLVFKLKGVMIIYINWKLSFTRRIKARAT